MDLPHNTFRPHNNAKCIAIILQKNCSQQPLVNMAVAECIGHDHNGLPIFKTNERGEKTNEIHDDLQEIVKEIESRRNSKPTICKYTFETESLTLAQKDILVPRYYWKSRLAEIERQAAKAGITLVPLSDLLDRKILSCFDGNGSPPAEFKGTGEYPYIRVKDIVNWQVYKDPTALIPKAEFLKLYKQSKALRPKDILYVRRGSYRIGSVAMVSPYDLDVVLTREILVLRVTDCENEYEITPEYLLYALSHRFVYEQTANKVFIDTTLPNIADRWKEIRIPIYADKHKLQEVQSMAAEIVANQWKSAQAINEFREKFDLYNC